MSYNSKIKTKVDGNRETKRLSKSRKDVIERIQNDIDSLYALSEIIKISNITPNKIDGITAYPNSEKKYIRENYTTIDKEIVVQTLEFDLLGGRDNVEFFKNLQRDIMFNIFNEDYTNKLLDFIFAFHPIGILSQEIGDVASYNNPNDVFEPRYQIKHKKAYHNLAYLLIKRGMDEIKKNLHPEDDKVLINNFELTLNIIRRLTYEVDKINKD